MAITTRPLAWADPVTDWTGVTRWKTYATSADASGCETIQDQPGAGYALHIERLRVAVCANITATLGQTDSGSAIDKTLFGPFGGAADGMFVDLDFRDNPIRLDENTSLAIDASGAGDVSVMADGFTASESRSESPSASKSASVSSSPSASPSASLSSSPS